MASRSGPRAGAQEQITALLARDPAAHAPLDDPYAVTALLGSLRDAGAQEQITALADRAVAHAPLDDPRAVTELLWSALFGWVGADQVAALLAATQPPTSRSMAHTAWATCCSKPSSAFRLLAVFTRTGQPAPDTTDEWFSRCREALSGEFIVIAAELADLRSRRPARCQGLPLPRQLIRGRASKTTWQRWAGCKVLPAGFVTGPRLRNSPLGQLWSRYELVASGWLGASRRVGCRCAGVDDSGDVGGFPMAVEAR